MLRTLWFYFVSVPARALLLTPASCAYVSVEAHSEQTRRRRRSARYCWPWFLPVFTWPGIGRGDRMAMPILEARIGTTYPRCGGS